VNTLVIGFGNPLRGDDGAGWHASELIAADPRVRGVTVVGRHQLTPELAEDVSEADLVVLVDASCESSPPGVITTTAVGKVERHTRNSGLAWSDHLDPEGLVRLAENLYGEAPPAVVLQIAAANLEPSTCLSPEVSSALTEVVEVVFGVIEEQRGVRTAQKGKR
jgi:hydrogenase maturation protease